MMQSDFEEKIKASLDESTANLDADTRKRLADMRRQALNSPTRHAKPARWLALTDWLPSTGLVFGVLLALFFVMQQQGSSEFGQDQVAVFEMLHNAEDLDTLSDPDFYLWADEQLANESSHAV
jgi:hypothetical protein